MDNKLRQKAFHSVYEDVLAATFSSLNKNGTVAPNVSDAIAKLKEDPRFIKAVCNYLNTLHGLWKQKYPEHSFPVYSLIRTDATTENTNKNSTRPAPESAHQDAIQNEWTKAKTIEMPLLDEDLPKQKPQIHTAVDEIEEIKTVSSNETNVVDVIPNNIVNDTQVEVAKLQKGQSISLNTQVIENSPNDNQLISHKTNDVPAKPILAPVAPNNVKPGQVPPAQSENDLVPMRTKSLPTVTFHIPNAKEGEKYSGELTGKDSNGRAVKIIKVIVPAELGLSFDAKTTHITGVPLVNGERKLPLRYQLASGEELSGECTMIINPDPRSLWKVLEPDMAQPYGKPHIDKNQISIDFNNSRLIAASRRGRSHEHNGSFRDDDFFIDHDQGWSIIIVADGAGSAKYSREGSRLAVSTVGGHIKSVLTSEQGLKLTQLLDSEEELNTKLNTLGREFHYIYHKASSLAVQAIEAEAAARADQPRAFATTLLAAAVRNYGDKFFVATFWLGDGAIAVYDPEDSVKLMGTPDGGEFAGQTLFLDRSVLSDNSFGKRVKIGSFSDKAALVLMTDGVSDPYFETDAGLADSKRWHHLWDDLSPCLGAEDAPSAVADWLHFFIAGHHDDRTVAVLTKQQASNI